MLVKSTLGGEDNCRPCQTVVADRTLKKEFAALVAGYTARELAAASGCTVDAAKLWLAGKRLPNLSSTINMAQGLPVVREWVQAKMTTSVPDNRTLPEIMVAGAPANEIIGDAWRLIVRWAGRRESA